MTLKTHNRTALAIARADVFFSAVALSQSPSNTQLQERFNDNSRVQ